MLIIMPALVNYTNTILRGGKNFHIYLESINTTIDAKGIIKEYNNSGYNSLSIYEKEDDIYGLDKNARKRHTRDLSFLSELNDLSILDITVINFNLDVLYKIDRKIKGLRIAFWKGSSIGVKTNPDKDYGFLHHFEKLEYLQILPKNCDSIIALNINLPKLSYLYLRFNDFINVNFGLQKSLKYLVLALGKTCISLNHLKDCKSLRFIELWQFHNLQDLSFLSTLENLEIIRMDGLRSIKMIPDLSRLKKLKLIYLEGFKSLEDISGLATISSEARILVDFRKDFSIEKIIEINKNKNFKCLGGMYKYGAKQRKVLEERFGDRYNSWIPQIELDEEEEFEFIYPSGYYNKK